MNKTIEKAKEQVINYYQSFIDKCLDVHGIDLTTIICDCVTAGINHSQRWTPVKEELPPVATRVLVKDEHGSVHVSYRGKDDWYLISYTPVSWRHIELTEPRYEILKAPIRDKVKQPEIMIEKGRVLLLYSCNQWHEHSGKVLIGVFTDYDSFIGYLSDMKSSGQLTEEDASDLLQNRQTQGLEENYIIEEEGLNPALSV